MLWTITGHQVLFKTFDFSFFSFRLHFLSSFHSSHPTWQNKADLLLCLTALCHVSPDIDRISQNQSLWRKSSYVPCARSQSLLILSLRKAHIQSGQWPKSETNTVREKKVSFGKLTVELEGLTRHRQTPVFQNLI